MGSGLKSLLAWVGFGLIVWGAWLAFPRVPGGDLSPGLRAVIVDASASASRRRPAWASAVRAHLRSEVALALEQDEELAVLLVGRDVMRVEVPSRGDLLGLLDPALNGRLDASATSLDAAIRSVELELLDPLRDAGSLSIIGDGEWSGPDPRPRIARLSAAGVACSRLGLGPAKWPDLGLLNLRLPAKISSGQALVADCELAYWPGAVEAEAVLSLDVTHSAGVKNFERALSLPKAGGSWVVSVDLGPFNDGLLNVDAEVQLRSSGALVGGDPVQENDRASARTSVGGTLYCLATAPKPRLPALRSWLSDAHAGLHWEFVAPEEVADKLPSADLLFSYDVSTARLPEEWLTPFLENGGGWIAAGGWGLIADYWPAGVDGSAPASELLPLIPSQGDDPKREVIFCVDGSGSMAGEPFESVRAALHELVRSALPSDDLKLRFFTGALWPVIDLGDSRQDRLEGMQRLLATRVPGGSTAILSSLERLSEERLDAELPGLVLLLSDGMDDSAFDVAERSVAIHEVLREGDTELSVIAIGAEADLELLGHVAGGDDQLIVVEELDALSDLFRQEVASGRIRDGEPLASAFTGVDGIEELGALGRSWAALGPLPEVQQLARMDARSTAEVLLRTDEGLPLLGLGRVGEGWAAVFPSLFEESWAPGYQNLRGFWGPLFRFMARKPELASGAPRLSVDEGTVLLRLGQEADEWPAELSVEFRSNTEDGQSQVMARSRMTMGAGAVGELRGLRSGALKLYEQGSGDVWRAVIADALTGEFVAELPFEAPLAQEFMPFVGEGIALGSVAAPALNVGVGGSARPDPRFVTVFGLGLILLALAAVLGAARSSAR